MFRSNTVSKWPVKNSGFNQYKWDELETTIIKDMDSIEQQPHTENNEQMAII